MLCRHVGGQIILRRVSGSEAARAGPPPVRTVGAEVQRRALDVLGQHLFAPGALGLSSSALASLAPDHLDDWNYPWRYESDYDIGSRIRGLYAAAFDTLFEPSRLARVLDNERRVAPGADRFTLPELFATLRRDVFGDLGPGERYAPDVDRRALQRLFVDRLCKLAFEPARGTPAEAGQLAELTLVRIRAELLQGLDTGDDEYAIAHLRDLDKRIRVHLEAGVQRPALR